ncbi:MAG TPA: TonB-dependent receptor [Solibacterales bacterium]|nr:TonB-dependent receptor [Bryobacterales bacterium]
MRLVRLLAVLCLIIPAAFSQVDRATLTGTITDPSGAVVPGASISVESETTGLRRQAVASGAGNYSFSALPIGVYTLTASQPGFNSVTVKDVRLGVGETRTLDLTLAVTGAATTVTVESQVSALERETVALGTVIGSTQARELPLNGRHWASLMALAPGAINTGDGTQQTIRFVGRARDDNNWTLDGLDATGVKDPRQEAALRLVISTDSIAEFRVNASLYSAESGGGAGAQINVVTKSGTNELHGSVFEFFRNDKMDSRNPFDTSKQPFRLNQFGGNLGGPIVRNKTFFFANYEGLRQRVSQTTRNDVPSAAFKARATNPDVRRILAAYPVGTESTSNAEIDRILATTTNQWREDAGTLRVDHRFNDKNSIFARYNIDDGTILAPRSVVAGDRQDSLFRPSNMVLQYQRIFSPTIVNEVKTGFNRSALNRFSRAPFEESIAVAGFQTLNNSNLQIENGTSYSIIDNLAINRGRHTIKIGGEIRRAHVNVADPARNAVAVTFASRNDLLANRVDRVAITGGNDVLGTRKWYYFAYLQDDWKILPNLTLNLGLRYEFYGVNSEVNNRYRVFDFNECRGFCPAGTPWYAPDRNNFDPRVGISWALFGGKTVIRTGAGIYHGPGQIDDQNSAIDNVAESFTLTTVEVPNLSYPVAPFLSQARAVGLTPRSLQRDRRDLYSAQWGFSIQQQLPVQFTMQVGYLGSAGTHVTSRSDLNVLDPVTRTRPLPNFNRIDEKRNDGKSNFNGLQVSLHRRMGRGFNWGTEYMWSHSINDGATGGGEGLQIMNVACRACDRAHSDTDIRHTFTSNWIYDLPFGRGKRYLNSGVAAAVFGNWEASGIWVMRTGRPLNITVNRSANDLPDGNSRNPRPNLVPGVPIYASNQSFGGWLNIAAFAVPASRTWGNLGRNIARGPGLAQVDFALSKRIIFTEGKELVLRGEGFNIFNRTQAGNPGTNISAPGTFGIVTAGLNRSIGTGTSRQLQIALRLNF